MYFFPKYRRGIFNKYSIDKPLIEVMIKDFSFLMKKILFFFKNGFKHKYIFIFPHYPGKKTGMFQISKMLNYNITNKKPKNFDVAIYWEYNTVRDEYEFLEKLNTSKQIVNLHSRDISKKYVDEVFTEVFGYSSFVTPLVHVGKCVKKSDINGLHNGEVITCPIKPEEVDNDFVYQKFLDTFTKEGSRKEIRLTILNGEMIFILEKYRTKDDLFARDFFMSEIVKPKDVFNDAEIAKILGFCRKIKLDFGDLDILRNNDDGKIYIIDVNNTPQQYLGKEKEKRKIFYEILAESFVREFI